MFEKKALSAEVLAWIYKQLIVTTHSCHYTLCADVDKM